MLFTHIAPKKTLLIDNVASNVGKIEKTWS